MRAFARDYLTEDPTRLFVRTRALRDRVFALLEGHQPPRQAHDLYVCAGYLCGLLAWMSSDFGQLTAADTQGRTAWLCAELSGHDALRAWVSSTRSKIAFWDGRLRDAITHARRGATYSPPGTVAVLLACQEADAWSVLGAADEAQRALDQANSAREALTGTDEVAGLFSCSPVRHLNYCAAVHLRIGRAQAALNEADDAIAELPYQEVRAYGTEAQLHISRATARLTCGEPEGATEALAPVLALTPERRLDPVTQRLRDLAHSMARSHMADSAAAAHLQGAIEAFCLESAPRLALSPSPREG